MRTLKTKLLQKDPDVKKAIVEFRKRDFASIGKSNTNVRGSFSPEITEDAIESDFLDFSKIKSQNTGAEAPRALSRGPTRRNVGKKKGSVARAATNPPAS